MISRPPGAHQKCRSHARDAMLVMARDRVICAAQCHPSDDGTGVVPPGGSVESGPKKAIIRGPATASVVPLTFISVP